MGFLKEICIINIFTLFLTMLLLAILEQLILQSSIKKTDVIIKKSRFLFIIMIIARSLYSKRKKIEYCNNKITKLTFICALAIYCYSAMFIGSNLIFNIINKKTMYEYIPGYTIILTLIPIILITIALAIIDLSRVNTEFKDN